MNKVETYDDLSTVLFLVPFLLSGVYGLYLWIQRGGLLLPTDVYLTVTRDPVVFLVGTLAVFGGSFVEVWIADRDRRAEKLGSLSSLLQKLAAASFILALICALYANDLNLSGTSLDFIVGRYALIFPALLVLLSYLIVTPLNSGAIGKREGVGIVVMLLVPAVVYEVGKRDSIVGIVLGFILLIVGLVIFLWNRPKTRAAASR
jgi:hypothetical protein